LVRDPVSRAISDFFENSKFERVVSGSSENIRFIRSGVDMILM
jgi:hypothetical protein